jgi:hypothetical protein
MSNLSTLADEYGRLHAMKAALEEKLAAMKAEFKAAGVNKVEGEMFVISQSTDIRQTLVTASVLENMGQKWFDDHSRLSEVTTVRVKAKAPITIEI